MVDEATARRTAEEVIAHWPPISADPEDEVVVWKLDEHSKVWIVHFATRRWVATRNFEDQLIGSCPLVVEKATGQLHQYGSGPDGYLQYKAWLDVV